MNAFTEVPIETVNSLSRWWFVAVLALLAEPAPVNFLTYNL